MSKGNIPNFGVKNGEKINVGLSKGRYVTFVSMILGNGLRKEIKLLDGQYSW